MKNGGLLKNTNIIQIYNECPEKHDFLDQYDRERLLCNGKKGKNISTADYAANRRRKMKVNSTHQTQAHGA